MLLGYLSHLLRIRDYLSDLLKMNRDKILTFLLGISLWSKVWIFQNNQFSFELQKFPEIQKTRITGTVPVCTPQVHVEIKTHDVDGVASKHPQT